MTTSITPSSAAASSARSSSGTRVSEPSSEKVVAPEVLFADELFEDHGVGQPRENAELHVARRRTLDVVGLDPLLDPLADVAFGNVHVFEADVAAVGAVQAIDQLAEQHRSRVAAAERGHDFAIEVGGGQAVVAWVQRQRISRGEAERIELGGEVTVDAIADYELIDAVLEQLRGLLALRAAAGRGRSD